MSSDGVGKPCRRLGSRLVDQMELLNGPAADQEIPEVVKMDVVGMVGETQPFAQEVRGSLGGPSQIDDGVAGGSDQLCCSSGFLAECIPVKTLVRLKELLGPNAEKELSELKLGLAAVSTGVHNPELSEQ